MAGEGLTQAERQFERLPVYLQRHSELVGRYAQRLAEYACQTCGADFFSETLIPFLPRVYLLGKYHDIGKVAITESIWKSSGRLNEQEQRLMRTHTVLGAYLLRGTVLLPGEEQVGALWEAAAQCCAYHHERWDGSGYPYGLCGEEIPLFARIISITDAYDAMTADRPYRKGVG